MTAASEWERCNPAALRERERGLLDARRERAGVEALPAAGADGTVAVGRVGVGLSGGGIRSATQSLGFFQALSRHRLLPQVDYLSTVSGGGYFGACLGRLFSRRPLTDELTADGSTVGYLRSNGNYLAPHGSGDAILAVAILLRNWLATLTVVGALVLPAFVAVRTTAAVVGALRDAATPQVFEAGGLPVSPLVLLGAVMLLLWAVPWGLAYWFIRWHREERWQPRSGGLWRVLGWLAAVLRWIPYVVLVLPALGWLLHRSLARCGLSEPEQRNVASRRLALALTGAAVAMLLGLADSLGAALFASVRNGDWGWLASTVTAVTAFAAGARKIASSVDTTDEAGWAARAGTLVLPVLAFAAAGAFLALAAMASFVVAVEGLPLLRDSRAHLLPLLLTLAVLAILCTTFRGKWSFVNRSSFHPFYRARLTRAFLGASNPQRHEKGRNVRQCDEQDDVEMADYAPHRNGGPLHLINVTVNETLLGRNELQDVRSRGVGMAIGPAGLSVAARHHALWQDAGAEAGVRELTSIAPDSGFRVFAADARGRITCEALTLGQWTAISGAAASTGAGARTSLPKSLLTGLFNVRLGYWWDSGVGRRPIRAVQQALLGYEFLARFPGVARRQWNLSDGGHFENLAGYELLRRRLPVVVICDFEQDEGYTFAGLGNLVRKARIDFGAEIRFVTAAELDALVGAPVRRWFGSLDELRRGLWDEEAVDDPVTDRRRLHLRDDPARTSRALFALAEVSYGDGKGGTEKAPGQSWLIYVKPALLGDEPADVRQYHADHPTFPHESTGDQFFDEAQWESYRRLGEHLGDKLFAARQGTGSAGVPAEWLTRGWVVDGRYAGKAKARRRTTAAATAKKKTARKKAAKTRPAS